jgi:hypothetical protein
MHDHLIRERQIRVIESKAIILENADASKPGDLAWGKVYEVMDAWSEKFISPIACGMDTRQEATRVQVDCISKLQT